MCKFTLIWWRVTQKRKRTEECELLTHMATGDLCECKLLFASCSRGLEVCLVSAVQTGCCAVHCYCLSVYKLW